MPWTLICDPHKLSWMSLLHYFPQRPKAATPERHGVSIFSVTDATSNLISTDASNTLAWLRCRLSRRQPQNFGPI